MTEVLITSPNESFAKLNCDLGIVREMSDRFCFRPEGYQFTPAYKAGVWNGEIRLVHGQTGVFPKGLVPEVLDALENSEYDVYLDPDGFSKFAEKLPIVDIKSLNLDFEPHSYQIEAVERILQKKRQLILSPTGSGKSLIIYLLCRSLPSKRILITVPNISLVSQLFSDFEDYSKNNGWDVSEHVHTISEGAVKHSDKAITIATWQSIFKQPASFFAKYDVVIGDECHLTTAKSLSSIMEKCTNAYIRAGVSGTLDGSVVNEMVLKGHYGPIYRVATTAQLMDKGILTNLAIKAIVLKHPEEACKTFGKVQYVDEMDYLVRNQRRNQFISKLAGQTEGNTLVLFQFVQKHGKPLEQMLKSMNPHREVYFVHGGVSGDDREQIRQLVERKDNAIIIASYATYSTGINVKRLHNIIFASPSKGRVRIFQSIGRGLRKHDTKDVCKLFDIADDLRGKRKSLNHTLKHFTIRLQAYMSEGFSVKTIELEL